MVTLPKITSKTDIEILVEAFETLEDRLGSPQGALRMEIMVETTQRIFDTQGRSALPRLHRAASGRLVGAHFGTYDYTAECDITAAHQRMRHPACDFAKQMMKVAFAGTGVDAVRRRDEHHAGADPSREDADRRAAPRQSHRRVRAWRLHADDVRQSLVNGFYQGWDLHPAQLPTRYGAVYGSSSTASRPRASASRTSSTRRRRRRSSATCSTTPRPARGCSTTSCAASRAARSREDEALATGLSLDEIRSKSFSRS